MLTVGYIACEPSDGDHISDHGDYEIRGTREEAQLDCDADFPAIRYVHYDGYLYVDEPEDK